MSVEKHITEHIDLWTAVVRPKSSAGRGSNSKLELTGIKKLRELILELAVCGKLVPQDLSDEPASVLLERIAAEKVRLVKEGKIKKPKALPEIAEDEKPFELPVGWEFARLGVFGETNIGLTYSPNDVGENGIPVLRSSNIQQGKIDLSDLVRVNKDVKESSLVALGDLLICARNGSKSLVGKTAQIKSLDEPMAFGAFMAVFRSELNNYIELFLNSPLFRRNLEGVSTTTINQITQNNLKETVCTIPPLKEQHRIVAKVDELMALCDQLELRSESQLAAHQTLVETLLATLTDSSDADELAQNWARLSTHFDTLFTTEASIDALKQTILQLAVMGKLVPQASREARNSPGYEPASALLERIAAEKARLVKEKKIKKEKPLPAISEDDKPFLIPEGWVFARLQNVIDVRDGTHDSPKDAVGENTYPLITSKDFKNGLVDFENARAC